MKTNARKLVNELFSDLGLQPFMSAHPHPAESEITRAVKQNTPSSSVNFTRQLSYFGKSMAVGDFDGDGTKEVYIGAPGYTLQGFSQLGAVYRASLDTDKIHPEVDSDRPHLTGQ